MYVLKWNFSEICFDSTIGNKSAFVQVIVWSQICGKPFHELGLTRLIDVYRQTFDISRTKSQNLNDSRLIIM